jgi:hypothetical protein
LKKNSLGLLELEMADLERFWRKTPLGPLGVKMLIPMVEMLQKEIQSLCNFSFLKFVKIEPANKVQSFFSKRDAFKCP